MMTSVYHVGEKYFLCIGSMAQVLPTLSRKQDIHGCIKGEESGTRQVEERKNQWAAHRKNNFHNTASDVEVCPNFDSRGTSKPLKF